MFYYLTPILIFSGRQQKSGSKRKIVRGVNWLVIEFAAAMIRICDAIDFSFHDIAFEFGWWTIVILCYQFDILVILKSSKMLIDQLLAFFGCWC